MGGVHGQGKQLEWMAAERITSTQANIAAGTDIIFNNKSGGSLAYDAATGIATLKAGRTYRLHAVIFGTSTAAGDQLLLGFVNAADNSELDANTRAALRSNATAAQVSGNDSVTLLYKATSEINVKLRALTGTTGPWTMTNVYSRLEIIEVDLKQ